MYRPFNSAVQTPINLLLCSMLWIVSHVCHGAVISVTANGAVGHMDTTINANCSLVEAIQAANTNMMVDACSAGGANDIIELPSGANFTATNAIGFNALPVITGSLTINGNSSTLQRDVSAEKFRLMEVDPTEQGDGPDDRAVVTVNDLSLDNGDATNTANTLKDGGAIRVDGFVVFACNNCQFTNNEAINGGALHVRNIAIIEISESTFNANQASSHGGAIGHFSRELIVIEDSQFTANNAGMHGGAIYSPDSNGGGYVYLYNSVLDNNSAINGWGGGIATLERAQLHDCKVTNNSAQFGGGVYQGGSELFLVTTTLADNSASAAGGGLFIDGLALKNAIYRSSVYNNSSPNGAGIAHISNQISDIRMGQSTVSGNKQGEQIYSDRTMFLGSCTIVGNGVKPALKIDGSGLDLRNTVITAINTNTAPVCDISFLPNGPANWILDDSCNGTSNGDPLLGPLADNGGPSLSHRPLASSPLIGGASANTIQFLQRLRLKNGTITDLQNDENELDQLGNSRRQNDTDIGSIEYRAPSDSFIVIPLSNKKAVVVPL